MSIWLSLKDLWYYLFGEPKVQYEICVVNSVTEIDAKFDLEKEVQNYLDRGWKLTGGVTLVYNNALQCYSAAQAVMLKYREK